MGHIAALSASGIMGCIDGTRTVLYEYFAMKKYGARPLFLTCTLEWPGSLKQERFHARPFFPLHFIVPLLHEEFDY